MSSGICFDLDQSKILPSGNGLLKDESHLAENCASLTASKMYFPALAVHSHIFAAAHSFLSFLEFFEAIPTAQRHSHSSFH